MKAQQGQQCSRAQFLVDRTGADRHFSVPPIQKAVASQLSVLVTDRLQWGLFTLFLLSPAHRICSGPSGMGGPQRRSVADRRPSLGPFVLTVTSQDVRTIGRLATVCSSSREPPFQAVSQAVSPLLNSA